MDKIKPLLVYPLKSFSGGLFHCYMPKNDTDVVKIAEQAAAMAEEAKKTADKALQMKLTSEYSVDIESAELYIKK